MKKNLKRLISSILTAALLIAATCPAGSFRSYVHAAEAPGAVTGLSIQVTSSPSAKLTWDKTDCDGFKVYRDGRAIARVRAGTSNDFVTYVDEEIEPGKSYTYSVRAYNSDGGKETPGTSSPDRKIVDGYIYEASEDGGIRLTGYTGREERLYIPDTVGGEKVTEIGGGCFAGNAWLKRVTVPEGVVKIGDYGFECCNLMQKVYLPDSLKEIGNGSFSGCGSLVLADMGDNITSIGDGAFMACRKLRQVVLPKRLRTMGRFAFAICEELRDVVFDPDEEIEVIPERAFCYCTSLSVLSLPDDVTTIGKRAFWGCTDLTRIYGNVSISEIDDYAFAGTGVCSISGVLADDPSIGFAVFAKNEFDYYIEESFRGEEKQTDFPSEARLTEGAFYGSGINGIRSDSSENPKFTIVDGSVYTDGGKTLFVYFPMELNEYYDFEKTEEAEKKVFHVPEGVTRIAPYAFFECGLEQIYLPSTLTEVSDHAFTRSGIAPDAGVLTDYDGNEITSESEGITFGELSFDKWPLNRLLGLTADAGAKESRKASENEPFPDYYKMRSLAGDRSLYRADDFAGYSDISGTFKEWCEDYIAANRAVLPMESEIMTYLMLYKGDSHFNQMGSILNGDPEWAEEAVRWGGHEFEEMYRMVDHGLFTELSRAKVSGDLILYSGITDSCAQRIAGVEQGTPVTAEDLIGAIGTEYEEKAMMSTAADHTVSYGFMGKGGTMLFVLASQDALNSLGTFCIDCFSSAGAEGYDYTEHEILLNAGSRFKVLDVGTAESSYYGQPVEFTYITMELLEEEKDPFEKPDEDPLPGKTTRGDLFNLAKNIKVTWKEVPGAKYYKVYREGITDPSESLDEPVFVTSGTVGWDNQPGLTDGHAYKYRIVASLTGEGDDSGDSALSYSKLIYRLKNVPILSVKNTAPGKATVRFGRTDSGDSYVLQWSGREDMKDAKTKVVKGADNTSCVIGGLSKGKTYYISIRVRKTVYGISYYTTFGVPKKIMVSR